MTTRITLVILLADAATTMRDEAVRSSDGNETGGLLLGHIDPNGTAKVRHAGDPGPAAVRRPAFFLRDLHHAQRTAATAFAVDGSVWIGEWHTHPAATPAPSDQDLRTYLGFLNDPGLGLDAFITIIVTSRTRTWDQPEAHAWICSRSAVEHVPLILAP